VMVLPKPFLLDELLLAAKRLCDQDQERRSFARGRIAKCT
jgi:hypothetical protein